MQATNQNPIDYKIHDTHAHLDYLLKQDPNFNIEKELEKYSFWIQPGVNLERDRFCLANYLQYSNMYFMVGAHPGEVSLDDSKWNLENFLLEQKKIITDYQTNLGSRIIAIGEIGLDYREGMQAQLKDAQKKLFISQLNLSQELQLPFVIHCRDAFSDLFSIIKEHPNTQKFLIHCFTGGLNEYQQALGLRQDGGAFVAFGGILTYTKTEPLNEVAKIADRFVLETDLPWLAPTPFRGQLNLPSHINYTAAHLAKLKNTAVEQIWQKSLENTLKIFTTIKC
jgi:TatD DNase family protein